MQCSLSEKLILSVQEIGQKYGVDKIILFGSRARCDNSLTSDIDLAIYLPQEFDKVGLLASDIDDMETLLKIDVVFIDDLTDKDLVNNIKRDGVIIYERLQTET